MTTTTPTALPTTTRTVLPLCCEPLLEAPLAVDEAEVVAATFRAVSDPVRLRLFSLVAASGEACVCDLPAQVDRSQATVSHHLKILVDAGLLTREQRGRWAWFRVVPDQVAAMRSALAAPS